MKKVLAMLLCLAMLVGVMAGCASKPAEPAPTEAPKAEAPAAPAATEAPAEPEGSKLNTEKEFTIEFMTTPQWKGVWATNEPDADYPDFWEYVAEEFNKKYPNVTVTVQVITGSERSALLNANLAAGTQPDIFYESMFPMTDYAHMGVLEPLDDILTAEDIADINPAAMAEGNLGGKQYFYPMSSGVGLIAVNCDYFRQAGLEDMIPAEGTVGHWTPEEFKAALAALDTKITKEGFSPFGFWCKNNQADQFNNLYLRMYGAEMFNEDSTACVINSAEGVKAATFLKEIYDLGYMEPGPETYAAGDIRTMFTNQEIAISYFMPVHYAQVTSDMAAGKVEKFEFAMFTLPSSGEPITFAQNYGSCVFTAEDPDETAWAKEFVKFYSSGEYAKAGVNEGVPARASVAATFTDKPEIALFSTVLAQARDFTGGIPGYVSFRNLLFPTIQVILSGEKTPQEALDTLAADATALIEEGMAESVLYG